MSYSRHATRLSVEKREHLEPPNRVVATLITEAVEEIRPGCLLILLGPSPNRCTTVEKAFYSVKRAQPVAVTPLDSRW
jgi:hypothetical protein